MAFDARVSRVADLFLNSLTPDELQDCRDTILDRLCMEVSIDDKPEDPPVFPNRPVVHERAVGNWHFRYLIPDANYLDIATIFYGPDHPKYPPLFPTS